MDIPEMPSDLRTIWKDLAGFQEFMTRYHANLKDPIQRETLGDLLNRFNQVHAEAREVLPKTLQEMKTHYEQEKTEAEELLRTVQEKSAEFEAQLRDMEEKAQQPPAPPPPKPQPSIDPGLAPVLGGELLARFGKRAAAGPQELESGSVWSHMEGVTSSPVPPAPPARPPSAAPPPRPKPVPPPQPAPAPGSIWSQLEGLTEPAPQPEEKKDDPKKPDKKGQGKPPQGWEKTSQVDE